MDIFPALAGHGGAPGHQLRLVRQHGGRPVRVLKEKLVIPLRLGHVARAIVMIGHPPLGKRGELVGWEVGHEFDKCCERIRLKASPGGVQVPVILRAGPQNVVRVTGDPIVMLCNGLRPLLLLLVSARDRQLDFRQQRRAGRRLGEVQKHPARPHRVSPAGNFLTCQQHGTRGVEAVRIPG